MNNQIKLTLGGKERELNFSTMGFIENLREVCGMDPLAFLSAEKKEPGQAFNFIEKIVHAGLLTQCDIDDVEADFDQKKVNRWVKAMEFDDGAKVILSCINTVVEKLGGKKGEGEAVAQTTEAVAH